MGRNGGWDTLSKSCGQGNPGLPFLRLLTFDPSMQGLVINTWRMDGCLPCSCEHWNYCPRTHGKLRVAECGSTCLSSHCFCAEIKHRRLPRSSWASYTAKHCGDQWRDTALNKVKVEVLLWPSLTHQDTCMSTFTPKHTSIWRTMKSFRFSNDPWNWCLPYEKKFSIKERMVLGMARFQRERHLAIFRF